MPRPRVKCIEYDGAFYMPLSPLQGTSPQEGGWAYSFFSSKSGFRNFPV